MDDLHGFLYLFVCLPYLFKSEYAFIYGILKLYHLICSFSLLEFVSLFKLLKLLSNFHFLSDVIAKSINSFKRNPSYLMLICSFNVLRCATVGLKLFVIYKLS